MSNDNEFVLRPGLVCQLESALIRNGWTVAEVNEITKGQNLLRLLRVHRGEVTVQYPEYVLGDDDIPLLPQNCSSYENWKFERNDRLGPGTFCLHDDQELYVNNRIVKKSTCPSRGVQTGSLQDCTGECVPLNLSYLRFMLNNPLLIPWEWQTLDRPTVWFSGTVLSAYATWMHREENWETVYVQFGLRFSSGKWTEVREEGKTLEALMDTRSHYAFF